MICANFMGAQTGTSDNFLHGWLYTILLAHLKLLCLSKHNFFPLLLMGFDRAMSSRGLNYKMSWHCCTIFYSNFTVSLCDYFRIALNHDWNELWPLVYWVIQIVSWCDREKGIVRNKLHVKKGIRVFFSEMIHKNQATKGRQGKKVEEERIKYLQQRKHQLHTFNSNDL